MAEDARDSREPVNGSVIFSSGESGTSKDLIAVRDGRTVTMNDVYVAFSSAGSNQATVELYDDEEGTAAGSLSNPFDQYLVEAGDYVSLSGIARSDVETDLLVIVTNNDDEVFVDVGGYSTTG